MSESVLVVGCGYLGRRVARRLIHLGLTVYATTRSPANALLLAAEGIHPVVGDVCEPPDSPWLPAVSHVFHAVGFDRLAGRSRQAVYVEGLRHVLDRLQPGVSRFVYASSTSVHGTSHGTWIDEQTPPVPDTESGRICLEAERLLADWSEKTRIPTVRLRYSGLYGPDRIIGRSLLAGGQPIPSHPDRHLNLIHVDDAATAAVAALTTSEPPPLILATDDRPVLRREYYERAAQVLQAPPPQFAPSPEAELPDKRISNKFMKTTLCIKLLYPDITIGLPASVEAERSGSPDPGAGAQSPAAGSM